MNNPYRPDWLSSDMPQINLSQHWKKEQLLGWQEYLALGEAGCKASCLLSALNDDALDVLDKELKRVDGYTTIRRKWAGTYKEIDAPDAVVGEDGLSWREFLSRSNVEDDDAHQRISWQDLLDNAEGVAETQTYSGVACAQSVAWGDLLKDDTGSVTEASISFKDLLRIEDDTQAEVTECVNWQDLIK